MQVIKINKQAIKKQRKAQRLAMLGDCLALALLMLALLALYVMLPN